MRNQKERVQRHHQRKGSALTITEITVIAGIATIGLGSGLLEEPHDSGVIPPPATATGLLSSGVGALPLPGGGFSGDSLALVGDGLALLSDSLQTHGNAVVRRVSEKEREEKTM